MTSRKYNPAEWAVNYRRRAAALRSEKQPESEDLADLYEAKATLHDKGMSNDEVYTAIHGANTASTPGPHHTAPTDGSRMDAAKRSIEALGDMPDLTPSEQVQAMDEQRIHLEAHPKAYMVARPLDASRSLLAQAWAICSYCERQGREMTDDERTNHAELVAAAKSCIDNVRQCLGE